MSTALSKIAYLKADAIFRDIIIGRVKLPAPIKSGHAFLLKRFDTNAIAASSMFRIAFPYASLDAEKVEMEYLEKRYDSTVANGGLQRVYKRPKGRGAKKTAEGGETYEEKLPPGSSGVKLQGTWIPSVDGLELSKEYGLERFARPLIEAQASQSDEGFPILTPSKIDTVSTPTSGRAKQRVSQLSNDESPSVTHTRATKRTKDDGSQEVLVEKSSTRGDLTAKQIDDQIKESQALAKGIQANGLTSSSSRKRRAVHQVPSADAGALDEDDYEGSNAVIRSFRRGTRAARRRPVVTTAGALGAAGAVGAGTLAWIAGGNIDVASQLVQQGIQNIGSWFF